MSDSLTISLSEPLRTFVLQQATAAGYDKPGDYVSALIDAERRRQAQSELEELLLAGIASGPSTEANEEYWAQTRRKLDLPHRQ